MTRGDHAATGRFFAFEGIEGSGKSTVLGRVADFLTQAGHSVVQTREPGGTALGTDIRKMLLTQDYQSPMAPLAELLLFYADRAQHIQEIILPSIAAGKIVLCDRFIYSTMAYQVYGRGLPKSHTKILNDIVLEGISIDGVILLDVDLETSANRLTGRGTKDKIEMEAHTFHQKVRDGFLSLAAQNTDLFCVIDGTNELEIVTRQALAHIERTLAASVTVD